MFDFLRVTCAVPQLKVGDVSFNEEELESKIRAAEEENADLVVFPELCLTGATAGDLFLQSALLSETEASIRRLASMTEDTRAVVVFGAPVTVDGRLYDCAVICAAGRVCGVIPKMYPEDSRSGDENRWFTPGAFMEKKTVPADQLGFPGHEPVALGNGWIFRMPGLGTFGVEVGSDLTSPLAPSTVLCLQGAELVVNAAAVAETVGSREKRRRAVLNATALRACGYAFASAGSQESTTDFVYGGYALTAENGKVLSENEALIDRDYLMTSDFDLGRIRADRARSSSCVNADRVYGMPAPSVFVLPAHESISNGLLRPLSKLPFVPDTREMRSERCRAIFDLQVAGLTKRWETVGGKLVLGVSGGLDSTLALLVAAETMKRLGRPVSEVHGITMPCFGTTERTHGNATALMGALGVTLKEISIHDASLLHMEDIGHAPDVFDATYENLQARERTQVLMDYAGMVGGLVVGTGDLSELALGWCTYNGDHMSMYGVNGGLPKTLLRWMIETIADGDLFPDASDILRDILDTPISPELLPPDAEGKIAQQTESIVGPYALHDFFLFYLVRYGFSPEKIYYLACEAFKEDFDHETVMKWLKTFVKRFFSQQFKRSCQPDGVTIGSVGFSPRGDWKMPSDASSSLWLDRLNRCEDEDFWPTLY